MLPQLILPPRVSSDPFTHGICELNYDLQKNVLKSEPPACLEVTVFKNRVTEDLSD